MHKVVFKQEFGFIVKWSTVERVGAKNLPVGRMLKKKIKNNALID